MTHAWTLREGAFREGASVGVADRGFRYGMSVFETLAVHCGRPLFAEEHLNRLGQACGDASFPFPAGLSEAVAKLPLPGEGMLRLYVTAGEGALLHAADAGAVFAIFEDVAPVSATDIGRGWRLAFSRVPAVSILGGWKTGNYWPHVQALAEAKRQGLDEAVMINAQGGVVSAAMANIFFLLDGVLVTPPPASGARDGVVRAWVAGHHAVREALLMPEDIGRTEECFLTNSRLGVMPVVEIEGRRLPSRKSGDALAAQFREEILGD